MFSKILFFVATLCVVNASVITFNDYNDLASLIEEYLTVQSCDPRECDQRCRRLKFPGGVCVNGRCKCDNFLNTERRSTVDTISETAEESDLTLYRNVEDGMQTLDDSQESPAVRSCNYQACDQLCRRLKFPGGACVNGRCKCDNFRSSKDFASLIENVMSLRTCYPQECEQRCRRLKFPGGACVNGRCKCDNFLNSGDDAQNPADLEDNNLLNSCNYQECDQFCRRLGFPGGACVNGRCKCDNFLSSEVIENLHSLRSCDPRECDQRCRRLKFPGGVCVNGRCKCDNFINAKGLSTNDETSDQAEESHSTLNGDFEENEIIKLAVCYQYQCNDKCIHVGYAGGLCKKNKCKCY